MTNNEPRPEGENIAEEPQVFAVNAEAGEVKFTRRHFLEIVAASAAGAGLAACGNAATQEGTTPAARAPKATATPPPAATKAKQPTSTSTRKPTTPTPIPLPTATVSKSSINMRSGPGTEYGVVAILKQGDVLDVLGRNQKGTWLNVRTRTGEEGWVALSVVEFTGSVDDLEVAAAAPPPSSGSGSGSGPSGGTEGTTPPGQTGIDFTFTDANGVTRTYTLPCGSPIPEGAVCVCNCVTVPASTCTCDEVCTCDTVCTCVGASHYWYPN